ncbi:MAG: hypothetical protein MPJ22_01450 [Pirellulales bacterium]|nr:hypothetical protein [Alphaproteobacteria bacterium]MDA8009230.1 hypothetical protein [Alphaproteobacteria bacterium]MDA8041077.1 hypothetical protein [Pirellulales bacterium]
MVKGTDKTKTHEAGVHIALSLLFRLGFRSATIRGGGNNSHILVKEGRKEVRVDVKVKGTGWKVWHFSDVGKFLTIKQEGDEQVVKGKRNIDRDTVYMFISFNKDMGKYEFYLATAGQVQDSFAERYPGGVRPINPVTRHSTIAVDELPKHAHNKWRLINQTLDKK